MTLSPPEVGHLVASLLSVNGYGAERAAALLPAFREAGLLDPSVVAAMDHEGLIVALATAGYSRGGFMPILSYRLYPLMEALAAGKLDELAISVGTGDRERFGSALAVVHGWGPVTIETAWTLWRSALGG